MASYDSKEVADLLKQLGKHADTLAEAYVHGRLAGDLIDSRKLTQLQKSSLIRPSEELGEYRVGAELKRLLNRLMRKQSSYRQLTDIGRVIETIEDAVNDYHQSLVKGFDEDADYYLDQLDDLIYEAKENLNVSLDNMHHAISSQFGFVSSISAKVRENERALNYAQKLLVELQQIDPETCYQWMDWACPVEFARKVSDFIYWFNQTLPRLRYIIDNMRSSLFRLRRDEKQAHLLRNMARYLSSHPEFEIDEHIYQDNNLPQALRFSAPLALKAYVDVQQSNHEEQLITIVQTLRKQNQPETKQGREAELVVVSDNEQVSVKVDFFELQVEQFFEQVITTQTELSALSYWHEQLTIWQQAEQEIAAKVWLELIFSSYCKLTSYQQGLFELTPLGTAKAGIADNVYFHDILLRIK